MEDEYFIQFLRARKYDVKRAFSLLQNKYKVKKSYADVYDDCDFDEVLRITQKGAACCLPYRDEDGCAVIIFKMGENIICYFRGKYPFYASKKDVSKERDYQEVSD